MSRLLPWLPALALGLLVGAAVPQPAQANGAKKFDKFCQTWMGKLAKRERANLDKAQVKPGEGGFALEYVGYSSQPLRCEAKATGVPSNPYVGKLVYHELKYRKAADRRDGLRSREPRVVQRLEVMEIFRYDGERWVY